MKSLYFFFCIFLVMSCSKSNDENPITETMSYQTKNQTIQFNVVSDEYYLIANSTYINKIKNAEGNHYFPIDASSCILRKELKGNSFRKRAEDLIKQYPECRIDPVLLYADGTKQITKGELLVKLTPNTSMPKTITDQGFSITDNLTNNTYLLSSTHSTEEIFSMIKTFESLEAVVFAEPNFTKLLKQNP